MRKKLLLLVCIISFLQTNPFAQVQNSSEKRINMWIAPQVHTIKTEKYKDNVITLCRDTADNSVFYARRYLL